MTAADVGTAGGKAVEIRDAATVVLLRDAPGGPQVWLLTRVRQMVFAAGMSVFPGGRVEDADADVPLAPGDAAGGAALDALAERFGCDGVFARRLLGAAARETFEETGVLLTTPAADSSGPAGSAGPADLVAARADVEAGRAGFADLLRAHGLTLDPGALRPWARWITPPGEARRYDTRFFVAALPDGVEAYDGTSESSTAGWVSPAEALAEAERGERLLLPPTLVTLAALRPFATVADVLAAADGRPLDAISPAVHRDGDRFVAELPDGQRFTLPKGMFT